MPTHTQQTPESAIDLCQSDCVLRKCVLRKLYVPGNGCTKPAKAIRKKNSILHLKPVEKSGLESELLKCPSDNQLRSIDPDVVSIPDQSVCCKSE